MKKKEILIYSLLLLTVCNLSAQKIRFGFQANPQLNWLNSNKTNINSEGKLLGLSTGIELDIFFAENYAFSTGVFINSAGGKLSYQDTLQISPDENIYSINNIEYRNQYLSFPLGLKFKTIEIGYSSFWLNPGLTPMFKLKASANLPDQNIENIDFSDETNWFNMNYFIEAGIEYSLGGNTAIVGGLGYYSGIMDITNLSSDKISSASVALILGIIF